MSLKNKLSNLLKLANQEIIYEDDSNIHLLFVMFNFYKKQIDC